MAARRDGPDDSPARSRGYGGRATAGTWQPAGDHVHVRQDVVETLLRRADLVSQLLRIGYARDPQGQEL
jgi:plasmid replication initiation protein